LAPIQHLDEEDEATLQTLEFGEQRREYLIHHVDLPLHLRLMTELWRSLCSQMCFAAEDSFIKDGDFFLPYRASDDGSGGEAMMSPAPPTDPRAKPLDALQPSRPPSQHSNKEGSRALSTTSSRSVLIPSGHEAPADKVPRQHPFFALYRRNHLRLPTPPYPFLSEPEPLGVAPTSVSAVDDVVHPDVMAACRRALRETFYDRDCINNERTLIAEIMADGSIVELGEGVATTDAFLSSSGSDVDYDDFFGSEEEDAINTP
jgi:hypothetical protein